MSAVKSSKYVMFIPAAADLIFKPFLEIEFNRFSYVAVVVLTFGI